MFSLMSYMVKSLLFLTQKVNAKFSVWAESKTLPYIHKSIFIFWSAMLVQSNKCVPVLRLYASLPRTSLLQGIGSTGASWPRQHFIFAIAVCRKLVNKPDCNGKPTAQRGLGMKSGTKPSQELLNICFPKKNKQSYLTPCFYRPYF